MNIAGLAAAALAAAGAAFRTVTVPERAASVYPGAWTGNTRQGVGVKSKPFRGSNAATRRAAAKRRNVRARAAK